MPNPQIQALVQKRTMNLKYLMRVQGGGVHWFNVWMPDSKAERTTNSTWCKRWLVLSRSIDSILTLDWEEFLHAAVSLLDQWSFQCVCRASGERELYVMQSIRMKNKQWFGKNPVAVQTINVPFELDYNETVTMTCTILKKLYSKLELIPAQVDIEVYTMVRCIDEHLAANFLRIVCGDMISTQQQAIQEQFNAVRVCLQEGEA